MFMVTHGDLMASNQLLSLVNIQPELHKDRGNKTPPFKYRSQSHEAHVLLLLHLQFFMHDKQCTLLGLQPASQLNHHTTTL